MTFGETMLYHRERRGLTREGVRARGGPSVMTQYTIETSGGGKPKNRTFLAYDRVFQWPDGTARDVWFGAEPPEYASPAPAKTTAESSEADPLARDKVRAIAFRLAKFNDTALAQVQDLLDVVEKMADTKHDSTKSDREG